MLRPSTNENDGGPAFPPNAGWRDDDPACRGMSLRDYFAATALQGYLAAGNTGGWSPDSAAEKSYEWADAMLKARRK